jgi:hypothetical protein
MNNMNNPLDAKEYYEHALNFAPHFPLGGLLLCLRVIIVNPALVNSDNPGQEGGDMMRLLANADMLLILISCQKMLEAKYTTPNKRM